MRRGEVKTTPGDDVVHSLKLESAFLECLSGPSPEQPVHHGQSTDTIDMRNSWESHDWLAGKTELPARNEESSLKQFFTCQLGDSRVVVAEVPLGIASMHCLKMLSRQFATYIDWWN